MNCTGLGDRRSGWCIDSVTMLLGPWHEVLCPWPQFPRLTRKGFTRALPLLTGCGSSRWAGAARAAAVIMAGQMWPSGESAVSRVFAACGWLGRPSLSPGCWADPRVSCLRPPQPSRQGCLSSSLSLRGFPKSSSRGLEVSRRFGESGWDWPPAHTGSSPGQATWPLCDFVLSELQFPCLQKGTTVSFLHFKS